MDATIIIALITTIGAIINALISTKTNKKIQTIDDIKNELKNEIQEVKNDLDCAKRERDKTYLIDFLADIENGIPKKEIQIRRAYEIYAEYQSLNGNSYVHDKWEDLRKLGKL